MSIDNTDDTCSGGDLNSNVRELLFELRSQKTEINLLKEEIRGSTLSVASEVKKLKTDKSIAWRFQGNRLQFEFNSEVEDNLKQVLWAIENGKKEYAVELINESCEKLKTRNKHIRIADSSEGGWETVNQYVVNPLADDSEDESRLNRAESRAVRKKKNQKSKSKTKASAALGFTDSVNQGMWGGMGAQPRAFPQQFQFQTVGPRFGSFRGYPFPGVDQRGVITIGPCFACGEANHIRRNCPYTRAAPAQQQPESANKK